MARIEIEDLAPRQELTDEQLSGAVGGLSLSSGSTMYDAWNPIDGANINYTYDLSRTSDPRMGYDAWMPG